ncbi:conjugal transfer protein TrbP [Legionella lansingensis]|uniref:TraX protein n=1 Tax=Legionella lansingensis TaxID=45067 RepID=A0A0W0VTP4_9GAMM|nr:TraX family protein [Legionella lansingensis]KTD23527.1 TraX protein [Legionella lansingensis]SNV52043.1 conjugal transfer protein TrbP [Legionella lansingensis]
MTSSVEPNRINTLPAIRISNGSLEALKWIGVVSMTIDHFNRFFFNPNVYGAYCAGRIAMPLFAFIFAYNLARPGTLAHGVYFKSFKRLFLFGVLATPAYMAMKNLHHIWPFNIMFLLLIAAILFYFFENRSLLQMMMTPFVFFIGGAFVEYNWVGVLFCISCWLFCRKPTLLRVLLCLVCYLLLGKLNENQWALASLPFIFLATKIDLKIPRIPYFFYVYYPTHLTFFWIVRIWINIH